jgi:hypothetical protein
MVGKYILIFFLSLLFALCKDLAHADLEGGRGLAFMTTNRNLKCDGYLSRPKRIRLYIFRLGNYSISKEWSVEGNRNIYIYIYIYIYILVSARLAV